MWNPASANLTFDCFEAVLPHGHIIAESFEFFWGKLNGSYYL